MQIIQVVKQKPSNNQKNNPQLLEHKINRFRQFFYLHQNSMLNNLCNQVHSHCITISFKVLMNLINQTTSSTQITLCSAQSIYYQSDLFNCYIVKVCYLEQLDNQRLNQQHYQQYFHWIRCIGQLYLIHI
ncbi:unnamed protein product (macronuclear) [Paramecium tetraurelia]|uniref:Transmembrane protein n=1 Tax=Paramecium tetraurelia TaxID=5888 RepID=A0BHK7_PARTE|nr:uncharacterized protein GSPATT00029059001 [Paramecium tetraurelia]CAK58024.1 unnamed protein product [Paramecium tetraurelia]|eukprot:XP_001425422.1 hypothetical protein (macronuclear) [Paramecium tetraurelia strain d4-2]